MPQMTLEYSCNLPKPIDFQAIFTGIEEQLVSIMGVHPENIKMRAYEAEHYRVGLGRSSDAFVHVDMRLFLKGREAHVQALGDALIFQLADCFKSARKTMNLQVTVNIHGLDPERYFKCGGEFHHE